MPTQNLTPIGRVCFPQVYEAVAYENNKPKFSLVLLYNLSEMEGEQKERFQAMVAAANKAALEKFQVKLGEEYRGKKLTSPFRKSEEAPNYYPPGHIFVKLSSLNAPGIVGADPKDGKLDPGNFYSGCYAHCSFTVYAYDKSGNRGVAFGLSNIQKTGDGEAFGPAKTKAEDDFETVSSENFDPAMNAAAGQSDMDQAAQGGGPAFDDQDIPF